MQDFELKAIEDNYAHMSDYELQRIATKDAAGLHSEVFDIIKKEIKKRNLSMDLMKGVEAQNKTYTIAEVDKYCDTIRKLDCPICGSNRALLNGTILYNVKSFLIFTTRTKKPIIACPSCLDNESSNAIMMTGLLGWWGFPHGIIYTPIYIFKNISAKENNNLTKTSDVLRGITLSIIGQIEPVLNDKLKMEEVIKNFNRK